jgi:hypothetical protein
MSVQWKWFFARVAVFGVGTVLCLSASGCGGSGAAPPPPMTDAEKKSINDQFEAERKAHPPDPPGQEGLTRAQALRGSRK